MTIKLKCKDKRILEEGVYEAQLIEVTEGSGKYGEYLKFKFLVFDENGNENTVYGVVKKELQIGNKLYKWLTALNQKGFEPNETVIIDNFINKKCRVIIINNVDDEGNVTMKIDKLLPLKEVKKKKIVEEDIEEDIDETIEEIEKEKQKTIDIEEDETEDEEF